MTHVLIVDDKEENLCFLESLLKGNNCSVESAADGAEALARARQRAPDLVISDLLMPVLDGYTLLAHWKADVRLQKIPFIVYTAPDTEPQNEKLALSLGADIFILNPSEPEDFMVQVRTVLSRATAAPPETIFPSGDENAVLRIYNESLVRELEEKTVQLRQSNEALRRDIAKRKELEAEQRATENRYRTLFDFAPDGILLANPDGRYLDANARIRAMLGYEHDELVGLYASNILAVTEVERYGEILSRIENTESHNGEWEFLRKNGSTFTGEVMTLVMPDGNMLSVIRDVTERNRAEAEKSALSSQIETQRTRLNDIVANVPGVVWETIGARAAGSEQSDFVSSYATTMLGYSVEEWLATPKFWLSVVHPDNRARIRRKAVRAFGSGKTEMDEFRWIAKDGRTLWIESRSAPIFDANGIKVGVRGVSFNITERKQAEIMLAESEQRLTLATESAQMGIWDWDLSANELVWDAKMCELYGIVESDFDGEYSTWQNSLHPDDLEHAQMAVETALAGTKEFHAEFRVVWQTGEIRHIEAHAVVKRNADGAATRMTGINWDITARKELEEQFRQSHKMEAVGVLAGGIAHDFNNLLTAIMGYSNLTLKKMTADDPLRRNIMEINAAGERAAELTSQLLAFGRKQIMKPVVHNINTVVTNLDRLLRRLIKEDIEFRTILDPLTGNINADPGQMEQVIMNLAVNARDAMPNGGILTIKTQKVYLDEDYVSQHLSVSPGQFVKIVVTDTGDGMSDEIQRHIFEPFFTTKEVGKGTGLGLSTVYGIVKQSGGDIMIYSEIGHGTTFKIYLPSVDEQVENQRWATAPEEELTGTETVLLVEDEESVRNLVYSILTEDGYNVLAAENGVDALSICDTYPEPIHLLLSDLIMPKMNGTELREEVIKLLPDIKILFMSGYTDDSISHSGILDADTAFIEKPFSPSNLASKVREVLDGDGLHYSSH